MISVRLFVVAIALLCVVGVARAEGAKPIVAVFDIENRGARLTPQVLSRLTDYLAARLAAAGAFAIVPRDQLRKRLAGQKAASYKSCYDQTCQIEIGKDLAAQKTLATQVMKIGTKCVVTSTLFDLKTSASEQAATAEGACGEDKIIAAIRTVVERMSTAKPETAAPATAAPSPRSGWLGASFGSSVHGVVVQTIVRGSPAATAGLRPGDRLLRIGETDISSTAQVPRVIRGYSGGQRVSLRLLRKQAALKIEARLLAFSGAEAVTRRACAQGDATGCHVLAALQRLGGAAGAVEAWRSTARACQLGSKQACGDKAMLMVLGQGTTKDVEAGKRLLRQSCDGGDGKSCHELGGLSHKELAASPTDLRTRIAAVEALYKKACDTDFLYGCFSLGLWYEKRDPAQAITLYQRACRGGEIVGCSNLGWLIYNGRGTPKDLFRGISLLRQGCREQHRFACDMLKAIGVQP